MFCDELAKVRAELEPWETQLIEHKGQLEVACTESKLLNEQHERKRAAYEDAQKNMDNIQTQIQTNTASIATIHNELERNKLEALKAHKLEDDCLKKQESLLLQKDARQKVSELSSTMESEKSQGTVLKAVLQAKEQNEIHGIYGRRGDLGAIDGVHSLAVSNQLLSDHSF